MRPTKEDVDATMRRRRRSVSGLRKDVLLLAAEIEALRAELHAAEARIKDLGRDVQIERFRHEPYGGPCGL